MEKFSMYDLLGLLLPGVLFLFVLNILNNQFGICSPEFFVIEEGITKLGVWLCFSIVAGASLYRLNFFLIEKVKVFNGFFRMYDHVADIFESNKYLIDQMKDTLNKQADDWFGQNIFFEQTEYEGLGSEKEKIRNLQDQFYDRMYYELEYNGKFESAKTFQSFYFFFRQMVLGAFLLMLLSLALWAISNISILGLNVLGFEKLFSLISLLLFILVISAPLARWYRKRMVVKMYWAYFTYLNLKN